MTSPRRWALLAVLVGAALALSSAPARASGETLTASPKSGPVGTTVQLTYSMNGGCGQNEGANFFLDATPIGSRPVNQQTCTSTLSYKVKTATCKAHQFSAAWHYPGQEQTLYGQATASFTVTCPHPTKSPTPSPKPSPRPRQTSAAPAPSRTANPTPSATRTPTPTPSATATPSRSAVPLVTASASPAGVATPPDGLDDGGSSGTPWVVGGALLGLAGLGASFGLLRPRGTGMPVVAGVAVVSVLAGTALALKPLTDPPTPVVLGSYDAGGSACAAGDVPLTGGFHVLDVPPALLHHEPHGSSDSGGWWDASASGTSESSTLCLRLGREVPWTVRTATLAGNPPHAGAGCQTTEQLLGGGLYVPWGLAGREGSHPESPARWAVVTGPEPADLPAIAASVRALCAELPGGLRTYTVLGSTAVTGTATARCFPGDAVLNGGYAGGEVRGSHPVDGGWQAELGFGGGTAYALCYHPSRELGLRASHVRQDAVSGAFQATAGCDAGDQLLGGGWTTGHGLAAMQHFRPQGTSWVVALPSRGDVTAYALCARRYG